MSIAVDLGRKATKQTKPTEPLLPMVYPHVSGSSVVEEFNLFEEIDGADIQKLLHCLTDTFEDNKTEAARILIACSNHSTAQGILVNPSPLNLLTS